MYRILGIPPPVLLSAFCWKQSLLHQEHDSSVGRWAFSTGWAIKFKRNMIINEVKSVV